MYRGLSENCLSRRALLRLLPPASGSLPRKLLRLSGDASLLSAHLPFTSASAPSTSPAPPAASLGYGGSAPPKILISQCPTIFTLQRRYMLTFENVRTCMLLLGRAVIVVGVRGLAVARVGHLFLARAHLDTELVSHHLASRARGWKANSQKSVPKYIYYIESLY